MLARGTSVGRYVVLGPLASGPGGAEYEAFDPELDLRVALKVLWAGRDESGQAAQTLRNAKALARMGHPNVLPVHDVGSFDGGAFVALGRLEGQPVRQWLATRRPGRAEVLEVFRGLAQGLAAAHAAGLSHGQLSPDQLWVAGDGRPYVAGLGHPAPEAPVDAALPYLAPEQLAGAPADARSDQFAFCVALYEALIGHLPFDRESAQGRVRTVARRGTRAVLPGWLDRVLDRGLKANPAARFPSMDALAAALGRRPWRPARRTAVAALGVLCALGAGGAFLSVRTSRARACTGGALRLEPAWGPTQRTQVQRAFERSGSPSAQALWASTSRVLDAYAGSWVDSYADACGARTDGEELRGLRMACLEQRKDELGALVALLSTADRGVVHKSVEAAQALRPVAACADVVALTSAVPPPPPRVQDQVHAARHRLAGVKALRDAGKFAEGLRRLQPLRPELEKLGYPPLLAEARELEGLLEHDAGQFSLAERARQEAVFLALGGGDLSLAARASIALVFTVGVQQGRPEEATLWWEQAGALLERLGEQGALRAHWLSNRAALLSEGGQDAEALPLNQHALTLREKVLGADHLATVESVHNLAANLSALGRYDEAHAQAARALALSERTLGAHHPEVARALFSVAHIDQLRGRLHAAHQGYQRALRLRQTTLGPKHPLTARAHHALAATLLSLARFDEALEHVRAGIELNAGGAGAAQVAWASGTFLEGDILREKGDALGALHRYDLALRAVRSRHGPDHPQVAALLEARGDTLVQMGRWEPALAEYEQSLAMRRKVQGEAHPDLGYSLTGMGRARLGAGNAEQAIPLLTQALEGWARARGEPDDLAEAKLALAKALERSGGDTARAKTLAVESERTFTDLGPLWLVRAGDAQSLLQRLSRR